MDQQSLNQLITFAIAAAVATLVAIWLGLIVWTWRDMRSRSRDPIAQIAAALLVTVLNLPGVLVYLLLRPRETLAEAYEHSLGGSAPAGHRGKERLPWLRTAYSGTLAGMPGLLYAAEKAMRRVRRTA